MRDGKNTIVFCRRLGPISPHTTVQEVRFSTSTESPTSVFLPRHPCATGNLSVVSCILILSYTASAAKLNEWYRLYLIPGAGHCSPSTDQTNGPFPQTTLQVLINWVEKGVTPSTLPATVLQGSEEGKSWELYAWPLRPLWTNKGAKFECVYDQASIDTWHWDLNAWSLPVY